ncbi:Gfo/Idh/MocA family oxidoreductase [Streptomyces sp. NPDC088810]|uniref:Gfo/Idh/MocA family oxidoreductase n=1 Tax=Streptomyces sp. NPDC088810 TaxID=3365904 RepID=UPI0037F1A6D5
MPPSSEPGTVLLADGAVGEVLSVHFEWLLDVRHGADCFRRCPREKGHSGGLMVHKSGHHFDLVNWWLDDEPAEVFGYGRLGFYGRTAGERHGLRRHHRGRHGRPRPLRGRRHHDGGELLAAAGPPGHRRFRWRARRGRRPERRRCTAHPAPAPSASRPSRPSRPDDRSPYGS